MIFFGSVFALQTDKNKSTLTYLFIENNLLNFSAFKLLKKKLDNIFEISNVMCTFCIALYSKMFKH